MDCQIAAVHQVKLSEEYVHQICVSVEPAHLKEVLVEKGMLESWVKEHRGLMPHIIKEINQLSARMEIIQDKIDWKEFHRNLLKVHEYYVNNIPEKENVADLKSTAIVDDVCRAGLDIETVMGTLNNLIVQSKRLTNNIECVEHKITTLDHKIEQFYIKYNKTLLEREKAFQDMIALQTMRTDIDRKLMRMEAEIHAARSQVRSSRQGVYNR